MLSSLAVQAAKTCVEDFRSFCSIWREILMVLHGHFSRTTSMQSVV